MAYQSRMLYLPEIQKKIAQWGRHCAGRDADTLIMMAISAINQGLSLSRLSSTMAPAP